MSSESPCLTCGACCANFRVSFYWGECQSAGGTIPDELTLQVSPHNACMKGTEKAPARCIALVGTPGEHVSCSIYEDRSSTCREFDIFNEDGTANEACTRARAVYGLPPINAPLDIIITPLHEQSGFLLNPQSINPQPISPQPISPQPLSQQQELTELLVIADSVLPTPDITHL